ncbi:hypothetical protein BAMA_12445 [Bacillus manliponensis]|uniref:Uncharacterized protein n=1 Tax=Bacillus manliponensis TaxID=574376 RepID=A0A073JTN5_9BACI|nr:hypothetical protein [Bacillus manliponensis]KEK17546.1 hypothetical protein BAMA_12445 [Bacillus manliponensis]
MCQVCNNTGIIRKETYPGVIETSGCTCEVAQQQEATYWDRWNKWVDYFESKVREMELKKQQQAS